MAVTMGNQTTAYTYNGNGDLTEILYSSGNRKIIQYDEANLLSSVKSYSSSSEELFSINRTNGWNGKVLLATHPQNATTEVIYDTAGKIVSYSVNGGISVVENINSTGKIIYVGGEVNL